MLAWEMGLPDKHGYEIESWNKLRKQGAAADVNPPMLLPRNHRAYSAMAVLLLVIERDGYSGTLRLNYPALRDFMRVHRCTRIDRYKILHAWRSLVDRHAKEMGKRSGDSDSWEMKKREFLGD